jgi:hypothetical protein
MALTVASRLCKRTTARDPEFVASSCERRQLDVFGSPSGGAPIHGKLCKKHQFLTSLLPHPVFVVKGSRNGISNFVVFKSALLAHPRSDQSSSA